MKYSECFLKLLFQVSVSVNRSQRSNITSVNLCEAYTTIPAVGKRKNTLMNFYKKHTRRIHSHRASVCVSVFVSLLLSFFWPSLCCSQLCFRPLFSFLSAYSTVNAAQFLLQPWALLVYWWVVVLICSVLIFF